MSKRVIAALMALILVISAAFIPAFADEAEATAVTLKVKATAGVNLRKDPSLDGDKLGSITKGTSLTYQGVTVYDNRDVAWHKVKYNKVNAWVSSKYSVVTVNGVALDNEAYVTATASVNLRKGPGLGYDKISCAAKNEKMFYLGATSKDSRGVKWYKVSCSKGVAWVSSKYSKLYVPCKHVETTASVNLRKGPGIDQEKVVAVAKGTVLDYNGVTSTDKRGVKWYKVTYKNKVCWVSSTYSKLVP